MTRWLVIVAAAVLIAFIAIIAWPRADGRQAAQPAGTAPQSSAVQPASFTVLIDGQEVTGQDQAFTSRLADLPVSSWESSMISSIRTSGTTQIAVFVDGSEAIIDSFVRSRMPADIAYRAGYDRD